MAAAEVAAAPEAAEAVDAPNEVVERAGGLRLFLSKAGAANPTGYVGVRARVGGSFQAYAYHPGSKYQGLGIFPSALEAAVAYATHMKAHGKLAQGEELELLQEQDADPGPSEAEPAEEAPAESGNAAGKKRRLSDADAGSRRRSTRGQA